MGPDRIDHLFMRTIRPGETRRFYGKVLGLEDGHHPPFTFSGAWLYNPGQARAGTCRDQ